MLHLIEDIWLMRLNQIVIFLLLMPSPVIDTNIQQMHGKYYLILLEPWFQITIQKWQCQSTSLLISCQLFLIRWHPTYIMMPIQPGKQILPPLWLNMSISPSFICQMVKWLCCFLSSGHSLILNLPQWMLLQLAEGISEFRPTPSENLDCFQKSYNVQHTLLVWACYSSTRIDWIAPTSMFTFKSIWFFFQVKFNVDAIDQTDLLEETLKPRVESIGGKLQKIILNGTHITPCIQVCCSNFVLLLYHNL